MKPRKANRSRIAALCFGAVFVFLCFVLFKFASSLLGVVISYLRDISSAHAMLVAAMIIALAITKRKGTHQ
jgi:hypothetical protein